MKTTKQILENLTGDQKQLLADTIIHGSWGDCDFDVNNMAWGYITDEAYKGGHFVRRSLSNRFKSLFKALGLEGTKTSKSNEVMAWMYDWWEDGTGSILLIRKDIADELEIWAGAYNNLYEAILIDKDGKRWSQRGTEEECRKVVEENKWKYPTGTISVEKIVWNS